MKKYILLLTLPVVCAMSAWAQVTVTQTAANQWQFGMPAGDVEVRIAYSDIAAFSTEPAAVTGLVYTGAAHELITAGASDEGTLYYRLGTDGTWLTTLPTGTEVGSYSVYYYIAGDANHNDSEVAGPIAVSIEKGTPAFTTLPTVVPGGMPFTGEAQTLVTAGTATAGTIEYSLDGSSWSADLPTAINIGAYTVYYRIRGNANYNDVPAADPLTAGIINPLPVEVAVGTDGAYAFTKPAYDIEIEVEYYDDAFFPTGGEPKAVASLVYSGTPQALVTAGVVVGGTMEYSLDGISWSTDLPQATDAGDYTVSYRVVGDATHGSLAPTTIAAGISKKELTVTAVNQSVTYYSPVPTFTVTYDGFVAGEGEPSLIVSTPQFDCAYAAGSAVGTYPVTPSGLTATNYTFTYVAGTLTVTPASLTVTADNFTIAYGEAAPAYSAVYTGWQGSDDASVLTTPVAFACAYTPGNAVGTYPITPNSAVAANYAITFVPGTLTVQSKSSSTSADITAFQTTGEELVYNGMRNKPTVIVKDGTTPLTEGVDYTLTYKGQEAGGYAESADAPIEAGAYYAVVTLAGNYSGTLLAGFTIQKALLTVTADDYTIAYGEAAPVYSVVYTGWQGADDASVLLTPVSLTCAYTQGSAVGTYTITPNSAVAANYAITFVPGTLTVQSKSSSTSADITATQATSEQLVYNGTRNKPTVIVKDGATPLTEGVDYTLTYKGQAAGGYAESADAPIEAGDYYAVVTLAGNYSGIMHAAFTIAKAPLTVTADNFTIAYGEATPVYSAVYAGWQGADDASVLTTPVAFACAYTQGSAVGTYSITPNSAVAANYAITFVPGTLTVQSKSSSTSADITATQATGEQLVYNGTRNKPTVTMKDGTTPLTEGVDYTLTYKGQEAGGYAESTDAPIEAGDYYAVVTLAGNYSGIMHAAFTIAKAPLTVTADNFTISYGEAAPVYSVVYTGWQGADDASVLLTPVSLTCAYTQGNAVGTYPITPNSAVAANYAITFVPGTLTVQSKSSSTSADITAFQTTGEELVYNGTRNKPTVVVKDGATPLTEGVDYTLTYKGQEAGGYAESADAPIEAGAYYAVVTLAGNYSGTLLAGFTIQKALLTVTADDYTIAYGEAAPVYTAVYTGWQGADDASVLTTPVAFTCAYTPGNAVGTYSITPNSAVAANYAITFVPGTLTVQSKSSSTSADITATQATGEQLVYNGTRNKPTVTVKDGTTPLTEGVDYTLTYKGQAAGGYAESADAPIEAGDYYAVVTLAGNYSGIMHAAFTIAKAPLTVTADDYTIAYGEAAPAYSVVYTGWQGADDASVLTAPVAFTCAYTPGNAVGTYSITPNSAVAANYAITFVPGMLTVQSKSSSTSTDITATQVTGEQLVYNGTRNKPTVIVKDGITPLTEGVDYTLTYKGQAAGGYAESAYAPIDAGAYYAVVTLTGNYSGTTQASFTIQKAPLTVTADNFTISYGEAAPAYSVVYTGWQGADDASVLLTPVSLTCAYTQGNAVGTYPITLNSAIAANYAITFVPGTLTVTPVVVSVTGVEVEVAKFADCTTDAVITSVGSLQGVYSSDAVSHTVVATFSDAAAGEHKTITLNYTLTGDAVQMANYILTPASEVYTTEGVILEPFVPSTDPVTREGVLLYGGVEVNAYGYCDGEDYSLSYHLSSGLPDQYKIDYADGRFSDVGWTYLSTPGSDGMIEIEVPADMPTGDYTFAVTFRDSRFTHLESDPCLVTIHVNLPESYVTALMGNVIVLVDTCKCFTDVQWYHRSSSADVWQAIPGATDYYYKEEGGLTGEYFVRVRVDGVETYTCPQTDVETLYDPANRPAAAKVSVRPNPVQTTAIVTIEDSPTEDHTLRIVSMNGWEVENRSFDGNTTTIDMSGCQVGNYMISVDGIVVKVIKK